MRSRLIYQSALFQQFQSAVYSDAIQLGVFVPRHLIKAFRIQVLARFYRSDPAESAAAG